MQGAHFALPLIVGLLALGGATPNTLTAILIAVAVVTLVASLYGLPPVGRRAQIAAAALWGFTAACGLQLVPLPPAVLRVVSPRASDLWIAADQLVAQPGTWHPISVDPPGTVFATATAFTVALYYRTLAHYAGTARGRRRLLRGVLLAVLVFDAIALIHPLFGLTKLYGFFTPQAYIPTLPIVPSLLNANHAAAAACVAPPLLLGLALDIEGPPRTLAILGAALSSSIPILTLSRGGMAVLAVELCLMTGFALLRRSSLKQRVGSGLAFVGAGCLAIGCAVYVALEPIKAQVGDRDISKVKIAWRALHMLADYPLAGVGRGAFASAFAAYEGEVASSSNIGASTLFTHVESWPVQLPVDVGIPVAAIVGAALAYAVVSSLRWVLRSSRAFGALIALGGLLLHDLFDFALDLAGVGMLAAALLAIVTSSVPRTSELHDESASRTWGWRVFAAFFASLCTIGLRRQGSHLVEDDLVTLSERWRAGQLSQSESEIRAAMLRHPAEPYFATMAGARLMGDPLAGRFFVRAVRLGPNRAATHFWFARWFVSVGRRGQAWAEYREALRLSTGFAVVVLQDLVSGGAPVEDIEAVAGSASSLDLAARLLDARGRHEDAESIDALIIERYAPAVDARLRGIERARAAGDIPRARRLCEELVALAPKVPGGHIAAASLAGTPIDAENALERGLTFLPDDVDILEELVRRRGSRLGLTAITAELDRFRFALSKRENSAYRLHAAKADIELSLGHRARALTYYLDAAATSPDGTASLEKAANTAESIGNLTIAEDCWRRLATAHPQDSRLQSQLERVHALRSNQPPHVQQE